MKNYVLISKRFLEESSLPKAFNSDLILEKSEQTKSVTVLFCASLFTVKRLQ